LTIYLEGWEFCSIPDRTTLEREGKAKKNPPLAFAAIFRLPDVQQNSVSGRPITNEAILVCREMFAESDTATAGVLTSAS
jgi:hypothetical protein